MKMNKSGTLGGDILRKKIVDIEPANVLDTYSEPIHEYRHAIEVSFPVPKRTVGTVEKSSGNGCFGRPEMEEMVRKGHGRW